MNKRDGAYGIVEQATVNRGHMGGRSGRVEYDARTGRPVDTRDFLAYARRRIREQNRDPAYRRRKLEEEEREAEVRMIRNTPSIRHMREQLDQEDIYVAGLVERTERLERMRTLPSTEHESRDAIAFHEAAHAVVGYIEGNGVESVTINVRSTNVVGGLYRPRRGVPSARCDVAGHEGTELAGLAHVLPRNRDGSDYRAARKTGADIPTAERDAREMLRRYWPAVKALAAELAWAGEVQGEDAERIIRDALSGS